MRYAIIQDGKVSNIAVASAEWAEGRADIAPVDGPCGIGWTWDGKTFSPPESVSPEFPDLLPWQFEGMVEVLGIGTAIEGAIDSAFRGDPERKAFILARYRKSTAYSIEDPLFEALAPLVGVTMDEVRAAWKVAAAQASRS